jgi:rhomboid protease GluP
MNFEQPSSSSPPPAPSPQRGLSLPLGKPFWVFVLLGLILLVFIIEQTLPLFAEQIIPLLPPDYEGLSPADFRGGSTNSVVLILLGANFRPLVEEGQVWRFFTSMFLHIGFAHLLFNTYALFIFGAEMERVFGRARFITIYVLSGLFGSLASFAFNNAAISAGASGAIFGIIGMQAAYFYKYKTLLGEFGRSRLMNVLFIVGINLFFGFTQPGIDNLAHLGGLVSGALLAYGMAPVYEVVDQYTNYSRLVDRTSLLTQFWVALVAIGILAAGTVAAIGLR